MLNSGAYCLVKIFTRFAYYIFKKKTLLIAIVVIDRYLYLTLRWH